MPKTETTYTDEELNLAPGWGDTLDPNIRKELRQSRVLQAELRTAQAELATERRQNVLTAAGVPSDVRGKAFARLYEGPLDDPAAVKAEYEALFGAAASGESQGAGGANTAGEKRIADAGAAGASSQAPGTVDLADAIRNAKDTKEVLEIIRNAPPEAGIRLPED